MNLVLLGPPGAGKGTQAVALARQYGIPKISTGDILREVAQRGGELGRRVADYIDHGQMVPDDLVLGLVWERLEQADAREGFLLDGFPRNVAQAEALDQFLSMHAVGRAEPGKYPRAITAVLDLEVDQEELIRRLSGRRVCTQCGSSYHLVSRPPQVPNRCDLDGAPLKQRIDDHPEAIRERLRLYHQRTEPVLDYYRAKGLLHPIDGEQPVGEVTRQIRHVLEGSRLMT
jgi:adenylate kinase